MIDTITQRWVRSAADEKAVANGCYFDERKAERVVKFFSRFLRHSRGALVGKPFDLLEWQYRDLIAPLFGWMRPDHLRRYRRGYCEIPKKNGKSTLSAGISLYLLVGDKEAGAEVYNVAGDRDQAKIVFNESVFMIRASEVLSELLVIRESRNTVLYPRLNGKLKALSAEAKTKEGLNIHGLIFDELHTQRDRALWASLRYGGASRTQPMSLSITTAGDDFTSICWEQHCHAERVLNGEVEDDEFLPVIYGASQDDDIASPDVWKKANPSLGHTIDVSDMRSAYKDAINQPLQMVDFRRYRLNLWGVRDIRWIEPDKWDACAHLDKPKPQIGDLCYVGVDLSKTTDIAALVAFFPDTKFVMPFFWAPERALDRRNKMKRVSYDYWVKTGHVVLAEGEVLDYDLIKERMDQLREDYDIVDVSIDPMNATQWALDLRKDGYEVFFCRQTFTQLSAPMKELERMILKGELVHHANPVLKWMLASLSPMKDEHENIRPDKKKSRDSIDGIVALIMAIQRWMLREQERSVYDESRGIIST